MVEGRPLEGIHDEDVSLGWSESRHLLLLHPERREAAVLALLVRQGETLRHRHLRLAGGNHKPEQGSWLVGSVNSVSVLPYYDLDIILNIRVVSRHHGMEWNSTGN